ncbi:MAG: diguanylate cyclase [Terracidiphilus sp.]
MRHKDVYVGSWPRPRVRAWWLRHYGFPLRLAGCFLFILLATVLVGSASERHLLWIANGVLLTYLLLAPRRRWPAYLGAGLAALVAGYAVISPHWKMPLILGVLNLVEVLLAALLLIDVDMFKSYNDTYGHLRGDSCLKHLAETVQDVVTRPGDLVARFGGEEFAIVLPSTPNDGAMQLAELVCAAVRQRRLPHSGNPLGYLTISAGCATMAPQPGQHAAMLIQKADDALYAAKRHGRNRACNANAADRESAVSRVS